MKYLLLFLAGLFLFSGCDFEPTENIQPVESFAGLLFAKENYIKIIRTDNSSKLFYSGSQYSRIMGLADDNHGGVIFAEYESYGSEKIGSRILRRNFDGSLDTLYKQIGNESKTLVVLAVSPSGNKVYFVDNSISPSVSYLLNCATGEINSINEAGYIAINFKREICFSRDETKIYLRRQNLLQYFELDFNSLAVTLLDLPNLTDYVDEEWIIKQGMTTRRIDTYSYAGISDFELNFCYVSPDVSGFIYFDDYDDHIKYFNIVQNTTTDLLEYYGYTSSEPYVYNMKPMWNYTGFEFYSNIIPGPEYSYPTQEQIDNTPPLNESVTYSVNYIEPYHLVTIYFTEDDKFMQGHIKGEYSAEKMHIVESYMKTRMLLDYFGRFMAIWDADRFNYSKETTLHFWQTQIDSFEVEMERRNLLRHTPLYDKIVADFYNMALNCIKIERYGVDYFQDRDLVRLNKRVFDLLPDIEKTQIGQASWLLEEKEDITSELARYIWAVKTSYYKYIEKKINDNQALFEKHFLIYRAY